MLLKLLRNGLGQSIVMANDIFKPIILKRSDKDQAEVDAKTQNLSLYQFHRCPFCVKVRREITRLNLKIELRDTNTNPTYKNELLTGGGKTKVPCLHIAEESKVTWLYESNDIIAYLREQFEH